MSKKVIGYGICGPGEADRYMRETLDCFKRLCDEVIILCNNTGKAEHDLIDSYGFMRVSDKREWGAHQWRIKQDFIERDIKRMARDGDVLVCLDMDEVLSDRCTKEWLMEAPLDAYHVFIVDLWNDPQHFKLESCFWNVRIWKWNGETKFKAKPVHCGLAPEWTYYYHRHAPFLLLHKGLMTKESRERKIKRYEKYDPHAVHLDKQYYDMLKSDRARPFDEEALADQIAQEVATYNQSKPKETAMKKEKKRYAYFRNPHGLTVDVPEKDVERTKRQPGMVFLHWYEDEAEDIEAMFEDEDAGIVPAHAPHPVIEDRHIGSYQRSSEDEKKEVDALNKRSDDQMTGFSAPVNNPVDEEEVDAMFSENEENEHVSDTSASSEPVATKPEENSSKSAAPKKAAAKKVAKK